MKAQHGGSNFSQQSIRTSEFKLNNLIAYTENATTITSTKQFRKHIYCYFKNSQSEKYEMSKRINQQLLQNAKILPQLVA